MHVVAHAGKRRAECTRWRSWPAPAPVYPRYATSTTAESRQRSDVKLTPSETRTLSASMAPMEQALRTRAAVGTAGQQLPRRQRLVGLQALKGTGNVRGWSDPCGSQSGSGPWRDAVRITDKDQTILLQQAIFCRYEASGAILARSTARAILVLACAPQWRTIIDQPAPRSAASRPLDRHSLTQDRVPQSTLYLFVVKNLHQRHCSLNGWFSCLQYQ